ncbi:MAG: AzlD domain-containing protein, partial [Anaerolineales bacterium]
EVLLIASMAAVTMATRIPLLMLLSRRKLPPAIEAALKYVPPAVLAAIILPIVLLPGGELNFTLGNTALVASLVAILVAWRTRNLLLTIVLGMAALLIWRALLG